ncbi:MAG: carbohydrate ABC transporter permease [Provencibacterium sp.]|jgi:multiple sugar transport system permease protein|nr:carbohydrate ABC transporter permease [Provencibacterium sp.]
MKLFSSKKNRQRLLTAICTVFVAGMSLLFLFPILWMLSTSLKTDGQVMIMPPKWIPDPVLWSNYPQALRFMSPRVFLNTLYIALFSVIAHLISCTLVAFGFARIKIRGSGFLFILVLSGFMLPYQVSLIPQFILFSRWKMVDTYWPLLLPALGGAPFLIFLARQFFQSIPKEMDESARIDGCGYFHIYSRIILPMSKPVLGIIAIQTFMNQWNDFMRPLIFLNTASRYTVSITLQNFRADYGMTPWNLLMAASLMCLLPCILLFFAAQKYFIQGIVVTGVKG